MGSDKTPIQFEILRLDVETQVNKTFNKVVINQVLCNNTWIWFN